MVLRLVITYTVNIRWGSRNRAHYENLGYKFTAIGDEICVNYEEVMRGDWNSKVLIQCEKCGKKQNVQVKFLRKSLSTDMCYECRRRNNLLESTMSFYEKCMLSDRSDLIDRWDYDLNKCSPKDIPYRSHKKFYFKCPNGEHESQLFDPHLIWRLDNENSEMQPCIKCNSFAKWGISEFGDSFLNDFWDYSKNTKDPWNIPRCYNGKVWIRCNKVNYHDSYHVTCAHFACGTRCPYCSHRGSVICKEESLGAIHPRSVELWSVKNEKSPFEVAPCGSYMAWWKCENKKHEDYQRVVNSTVTACGFRCPICSSESNESRFQNEVRIYIERTGYTILHEHNCTITPINPKTGKKLLFDNEIKELRLLIEVHGQQHYSYNTGFNKGLSNEEKIATYNELKWRDEYKKQYAIDNGYAFLEIPYYDIPNEKYKDMIDNIIGSILENVPA
jgi:hypothetical protein